MSLRNKERWFVGETGFDYRDLGGRVIAFVVGRDEEGGKFRHARQCNLWGLQLLQCSRRKGTDRSQIKSRPVQIWCNWLSTASIFSANGRKRTLERRMNALLCADWEKLPILYDNYGRNGAYVTLWNARRKEKVYGPVYGSGCVTISSVATPRKSSRRESSAGLVGVVVSVVLDDASCMRYLYSGMSWRVGN